MLRHIFVEDNASIVCAGPEESGDSGAETGRVGGSESCRGEEAEGVDRQTATTADCREGTTPTATPAAREQPQTEVSQINCQF